MDSRGNSKRQAQDGRLKPEPSAVLRGPVFAGASIASAIAAAGGGARAGGAARAGSGTSRPIQQTAHSGTTPAQRTRTQHQQQHAARAHAAKRSAQGADKSSQADASVLNLVRQQRATLSKAAAATAGGAKRRVP